jgi:hypothetical protein
MMLRRREIIIGRITGPNSSLDERFDETLVAQK